MHFISSIVLSSALKTRIGNVSALTQESILESNLSKTCKQVVEYSKCLQDGRLSRILPDLTKRNFAGSSKIDGRQDLTRFSAIICLAEFSKI